MKLKSIPFVALWLLMLLMAWRADPWGHGRRESALDRLAHDGTFHMHRPLHEGGKVSMVDQLHLELVSRADGTHTLWISNAFRQEMDPAGFEGSLTLEPAGGPPLRVPFERAGRGKQLVARTEALSGQVWLTIDGGMSRGARFEDVTWFWDYGAEPGAGATPLGLDPMRPSPAGEAPAAAQVDLGRDLFFDARLSADGTVSCASCHRPEHAYAEPRAVARGVAGRPGGRNTPTVLNAAYQRALFWDGRSASLEEQALEPILNHAEMGLADLATLVSRLEEKYGARAREAFGRPLSPDTVAAALASYERTLLSGDSDLDRHEDGRPGALDGLSLRGRALFFGKGGCGTCHVPPLFTDFEYHNLGVGWRGPERGDRGRFEVTGRAEDLGAFRTPSLRDVSQTAPYMHDGSLATLRDVVELYDRGGRPNPRLDPLLGPLDLAEDEIDALVAFLGTLVGRSYPRTPPPGWRDRTGQR